MGTRRFPVNFDTRHPHLPAANNLHLEGTGTLLIEFDRVVLIPDHPGSGFFEKEPVFEFAEIANVELIPDSCDIVIRSRDGMRYVSVRAESRSDAQMIEASLPRLRTQNFQAGSPEDAANEWRLRWLDGGSPVTHTLIALNIIMFLLMWWYSSEHRGASADVYETFGSLDVPRVRHGEYWRILTATFVHMNSGHLIGNMLALYYGGQLAERIFGSSNLAVIYLLAGFTGVMTTIVVHPEIDSMGASGAIFGVFGAVLACLWHRPQDFSIGWAVRVGGGLVTIIATNLLVGWVEPVIDNAAHIGGFIAGAAVGWILSAGASRRLAISDKD